MLKKNKKRLLAIAFGLFILIWVINNNYQKFPNDSQVQALFGPYSSYQFVSYKIGNNMPYVTFYDKLNDRYCTVNLIKDYKLGFFNGNWIFGSSWSCTKD